ncbi:beta-microseminoprotein-like [Hypanus sabinus]|uniref:beta-microseminoprotein-like n=1 Tax=Hypanus sabinus TaxID=79690 RepID=UPI0028C42BF7|nr:beta-microseminoprotein-like [Hypanus sabinus]XP_059821605.1 beta-microseminoprotein-like [Hypanus sabinus]
MKLLLCIALLLLAAQLSESFCALNQRTPLDGSSLSEQPCIDPLDGASYPVGETWIDAGCMRCTCGVNTIECCTTYVRPVGYSEDCEAKFNCRECRYRVYRKDNPAIECEFSGAVGK